MHRLSWSVALTAAAALLVASPVLATTLKHMNLEDLAGSADRIFSGRVIDVNKGTVRAGGSDLPTMTYRVAVETSLQGEFTEHKGERIVEITMIHDVAGVRHGTMVRHAMLPKMPDIRMGQRYLFFMTRPSEIGLSTTVGLGQGAFRLVGDPNAEMAVNEFDNVGLYYGMGVSWAGRGPVDFADLTDQIRALLGSK